jgi:hypothetical protein
MSRARLVPLALVVTLLLAIVAITARGRPLGSSSGHGGLPLSFWDYAYTTIVIAAVPLLLAGVVAAAFIRRRHGKQRSYWQSLIRTLVIMTLVLAVELLVIRHLHLHRHHHSPQQPAAGQPGARSNLTGRHPGGSRHLRFRWDELAIAAGLLLLLGAVAFAAVRRSRQEPGRPRERAPEALAAALDESLDDLRNDVDLRRAIVAAYARMERALAAAGIPRHHAEAPLEYLERALLTLDTSAEAVRTLTDLFEWARFSHHEPEPSMRDEAVDALIAVRDELRASELVPA